jgi:putative acetyltransferase
VAFTPKGLALVNVLQPLWRDIQDAVDAIIRGTGTDVLSTIKSMEQLLAETPTSKLVQAQWHARAKQNGDSNGSRSSESGVHIRVITPRDNSRIATIIRAVMTEMGASGPGYSIHDAEVDYMFEAYTTPRSRYFVALYDTHIVGGCGVAPLAQSDPNVCELKKMYVLPEGRNLGVGRVLLDRCLDAARDLGYVRCYLETLHSMHAAQRLYERAGFMPVPAPLGNTGHFSCDAFYIKELQTSKRESPHARATNAQRRQNR